MHILRLKVFIFNIIFNKVSPEFESFDEHALFNFLSKLYFALLQLILMWSTNFNV